MVIGVEGLGFVVWGGGFRVQGVGCRMHLLLRAELPLQWRVLLFGDHNSVQYRYILYQDDIHGPAYIQMYSTTCAARCA